MTDRQLLLIGVFAGLAIIALRLAWDALERQRVRVLTHRFQHPPKVPVWKPDVEIPLERELTAEERMRLKGEMERQFRGDRTPSQAERGEIRNEFEDAWKRSLGKGYERSE